MWFWSGDNNLVGKDRSVQQLRGPGSAFVCLFDDEGNEGLVLPPEIQAIYGWWPLPRDHELPYTYVNFVVSRDGRVSFNEPGKSSGGPISGHNQHDRWLMALLRARRRSADRHQRPRVCPAPDVECSGNLPRRCGGVGGAAAA